MSFDDLTKIWDSPQNQPSPEELEQAKKKFITDLRRRHRGFEIFMAMVFTVLVIFTGRILLRSISPDPEIDNIDLSREWGLIPFFLVPWAAWIYCVDSYRRHCVRHPDYETSIPASLQAMLDENRITRMRSKFIAGLQIGLLVLLPLIVHQLKAVGKAGDEINAMFVLFPALFGGIMLGMFWNYRRSLLPRKQKLEALLSSYESNSRTK